MSDNKTEQKPVIRIENLHKYFGDNQVLRGIDLEVHFLDTELQNACTERATGDLGLPVCQMWHEGGVLVEGNNVVTMGQVRIVK